MSNSENYFNIMKSTSHEAMSKTSNALTLSLRVLQLLLLILHDAFQHVGLRDQSLKKNERLVMKGR
jgi:hypothetical protein